MSVNGIIAKMFQPKLKITKDDHGEGWYVTRGANVLFAGTKEACEKMKKEIASGKSMYSESW